MYSTGTTQRGVLPLSTSVALSTFSVPNFLDQFQIFYLQHATGSRSGTRVDQDHTQCGTPPKPSSPGLWACGRSDDWRCRSNRMNLGGEHIVHEGGMVANPRQIGCSVHIPYEE